MMEFLHGPGWTSILHRSTVPSKPGAIVYKILTGLEANPSPLQFIYSEKAAKFEKISILVLMLLSAQTSWLTLLLVLEKNMLIKSHV